MSQLLTLQQQFAQAAARLIVYAATLGYQVTRWAKPGARRNKRSGMPTMAAGSKTAGGDFKLADYDHFSITPDGVHK